jgi:hypothetical protein
MEATKTETIHEDCGTQHYTTVQTVMTTTRVFTTKRECNCIITGYPMPPKRPHPSVYMNFHQYMPSASSDPATSIQESQDDLSKSTNRNNPV